MTDLRERLQWVICQAGGNSDMGCCYTDDCPEGCRYDEQMDDKKMDNIATATVNALLAFLSDNGLAIVPVEAIEHMTVAGGDAQSTSIGSWGELRVVWNAMVEAAPPAASLLTKDKP